MRRAAGAVVPGLLALFPAAAASAETVTANCTGMFNLDIYTFDTTKPEQVVGELGMANFTMTEEAIVITGSFGEYRYDLKLGTLYHNGADTGLYCTYAGLPGR